MPATPIRVLVQYLPAMFFICFSDNVSGKAVEISQNMWIPAPHVGNPGGVPVPISPSNGPLQLSGK